MKYTAETVNYQYYALFEMKQTSLFESPNFKPRGRDGIVCLALIFSFYSHVVIQRLLYTTQTTVWFIRDCWLPSSLFPTAYVVFPKGIANLNPWRNQGKLLKTSNTPKVQIYLNIQSSG